MLPQAYRDLLEVAEDAGRPLRAAQIAAAAGLSTDKARVETLRSKLKRLVERGWLWSHNLKADNGHYVKLIAAGVIRRVLALLRDGVWIGACQGIGRLASDVQDHDRTEVMRMVTVRLSRLAAPSSAKTTIRITVG